jgi:cobalt-precorrin-7 (C5)-methyltransferase
MGKVFAVGVGPGSKNYVTETVRKTVEKADIIVGYKYTLEAIADLIKDKKTHVITMADQEETYQNVKKELGGGSLVVPFTGDVNFSESEVVDRLVEIFGDVELVPELFPFKLLSQKPD